MHNLRHVLWSVFAVVSLSAAAIPALAQLESYTPPWEYSDEPEDRRSSGRERRITCESEEGDYRFCRADIRGRVRLVDRLSDAPCTLGRSWGYDRRGIWVDRGCRGRFAYGVSDYDDDYGGGGGRERTVNCESEDGSYRFCRADIRGRVRLERRFSDAPCTLGRTWGYDRRGIWVDRGCRGRFSYYR